MSKALGLYRCRRGTDCEWATTSLLARRAHEEFAHGEVFADE